MKKIIHASLLLMLSSTIFYSCVKDEVKAVFKKPDSVMGFTTSANNIVLTAANDSTNVVTFNWSKPDYGVAIISTYTLQFDVPSDTSGPKAWGNAINVSIQNGGLTKAYLGTNFNALAATQLNLPTGKASNIVVRILSDINQTTGATSIIPSIYAVLGMVVTPYKALIVYPALLVKGGNSWKTPSVRTDAYLLTSVKFDNNYEGYLNLTNADGWGGDALQLIATVDGKVYGYGSSSTTMAVGGGNLWFTPAPGYFKVNADTKSLTIAIKAVKFFISGDNNGWSTSATPMVFDATTNKWVANNVTLTAGKAFQFTANGSYDISYKVDIDGKLSFAGAPNWPAGNNIVATKSGIFTVTLDMSQGEGNYAYSIK